MSLLEVFHWLEYTPLLVEMRGSPWLFPAIATIHLFGLAIIGGAVLVVDLRLLGLGLSQQPAARLARDTTPILIAGLSIMLPTGILLFMCFATKYYYLTAFWVKLTSLALVLALAFVVRRELLLQGETARESVWGKPAAALSLALWLSVALGGRLIGFP